MALQRNIVVLGGTGFVGRHIAERLSAAGHRVKIITRRRERHRDLLVLPTVTLVEGSVYNDVLLNRELAGQDAVINLVGILNEAGRDGRGFERVHAELPARVVQACRKHGVRRLLHMSALNAAPTAPSHYLRSKARGEALVMEAESPALHVTAFRPSVIFGPGDSFTNRFARLLRLTPLAFPLACPHSRFQPLYVEDVARAFVTALDMSASHGRSYDLCGPKVYTLEELVRYLAALIGTRRWIVPLGDRLSRLQAAVLQYAPGKPFTLDNYRSLSVASVCRGEPPAELGIRPRPLEDIVPTYLGPRAERNPDDYRRTALR
jgi:NADH dehydrogenase